MAVVSQLEGKAASLGKLQDLPLVEGNEGGHDCGFDAQGTTDTFLSFLKESFGLIRKDRICYNA